MSASAIDVIAEVPLGQKERAVLLQVGTTQILLGVAPGRVNALHVLAEPLELAQAPGAPATPRRLVPRPAACGAWASEPRARRICCCAPRRCCRRSPLPQCAAEPGIPALTVQNGAGGGGQTYTLTLQVLALMTALTLLPAILLMMTAFTRIVIVLGILRQALGAGQTPPNQVLIGLALFLTLFVMSPVRRPDQRPMPFKPYLAGTIDATAALQRAVVPLKKFMLRPDARERHRHLRAHLGRQGLRHARRTCR